ncbi:MAG: site-specific integrase [Porticoccus sp.]
MPTIRKLPSGKFQAVVRLTNLKPLYATFPTKTKAKQWAQSVETDTALARKLASRGDLSLQQAVQIETNKGAIRCLIPYFQDWIDEYLSNTKIADKSARGRLNFWKGRFDGRLVTDINPEDIDDILLVLSKERTGSTLNRYKSNLSSIFIAFNRHPTYKRLKFSNPVRSEFVSSFPENQPKNRFLSTEEQKELLSVARGSHWNKLYLLTLFALTTGARRGELLRLSWQDIDFANKTAKLNTTKNKEPRLLPLLAPVIEELMRFRENNTHLIFPSTVNPLSPFDFKKAWQAALKEAKLTNVRFHDLRHTAASNMVGASRTLFETGTLLGHKQSSTTMRYAHLAHHHTSKMAEEVWEQLHGK